MISMAFIDLHTKIYQQIPGWKSYVQILSQKSPASQNPVPSRIEILDPDGVCLPEGLCHGGNMSASHYHHYRYSEEAGCSPCDRGADGMLSGAGTQQQFGRMRRGLGEKAQCTSWNGDKNSKFLGLNKEFHTDMLTKGSLYKIRLHFPFMVKRLLFKW